MENRSINNHLDFLKLIAHDVRWQILSALAESDLRVHEIAQGLGQPQNLVSYHLHKLKQAMLVQENHSQADARSIYYHLNYERIQNELQGVGKALLPVAVVLSSSYQLHHDPMRVLFVCTHNSARSQMAEGMLRAWGGKQVLVSSAGSEPKPVHELAIQVMKEKSIDIHHQQSKGLETFSQEPFDCVITVCDRARENCPAFPGKPVQIHWSIPDPARFEGSEDERLDTFRSVADELAERIRFLLGRFAVEKE
jgi:thioredoxin type arsenate reductase